MNTATMIYHDEDDNTTITFDLTASESREDGIEVRDITIISVTVEVCSIVASVVITPKIMRKLEAHLYTIYDGDSNEVAAMFKDYGRECM